MSTPPSFLTETNESSRFQRTTRSKVPRSTPVKVPKNNALQSSKVNSCQGSKVDSNNALLQGLVKVPRSTPVKVPRSTPRAVTTRCSKVKVNSPPSFTMISDDLKRKAKCWSFIFTSFTDHDVTRLSGLSVSFAYISFAVCTDDTGNQFLQGFVRSHERCYKSLLYRLIGDNVIYNIPETNQDVCYVLLTIQLGSSPQEFGSAANSRFNSFLKDIKEFKASVKRGIALNKLTRMFPGICLCFPRLVQKHLNQHPAPQTNPREITFDEWMNDGSPSGLPMQVYRAWKKGEMYKASEEELQFKMEAIKKAGDRKRKARKVYMHWLRGEMFES